MRPLMPMAFLLACHPSDGLTIVGPTDADTDTVTQPPPPPPPPPTPTTDGTTDTDPDTDTYSPTDTDTDDPTGTDTDTITPPPTEPSDEPIPDIIVDCEGGADYESIQAAINNSVSGDLIHVMPCIYRERLDLDAKTVEIVGVGGSAVTIIDAEQAGTVIDIELGEGLGMRIAGFTVTGGLDDVEGAGMEVNQSVIEMEDVVFTGNEGFNIIHAFGGMIDLHNVHIVGNDISGGDGSGIYAKGGGLSVSDSVIDCDNGLNGLWHHNSLVMSDTTITCLEGYALHDYHGEDQIRRCKLIGGLAGIYAYDTEPTDEEPDTPSERLWVYNTVAVGAIGIDMRWMDATIINSIAVGETSAISFLDGNPSLIENTLAMGAACGLTVVGTSVTTNYNATWDNDAPGCGAALDAVVNTDPMFVNYPDDLHLMAGSPLIDAGEPGAAAGDADGTPNDIGIYGGKLPYED